MSIPFFQSWFKLAVWPAHTTLMVFYLVTRGLSISQTASSVNSNLTGLLNVSYFLFLYFRKA